jgi:hypothetical protein
MTDWNNKEEVLEAVRNDGYALKQASEKLKGDREVVMAAVEKKGSALKFVGEELREDQEVVLAAVENRGFALEYASEKLRGDREVVMAAVTQNGRALKYACDELKADKEVVMAGGALKYACDELKADKEVVMAAVKESGHAALEFADKSIKADLEALLMTDNKIAQQAKEFFSENNSEHFYDLYKLVQDHIMNNPEYVIKLLQADYEKFTFSFEDFETFPKKIRDNLDVMKVAVHINPRSIEYMSKDYINSELFMIIYNAFKNNYWDEDEISEFTGALTTSSSSEDKDLIKYLSKEISDDSSLRENSTLPFRLQDACSKSLFKDKDILLVLLENFYMAIGQTVYGDGYYFHWTEVISCEHFSEKMQGSGLLKDPDIIDLLKNISVGIEKHFTLMRKENLMLLEQAQWIHDDADKHWIMLFRDLSKG